MTTNPSSLPSESSRTMAMLAHLSAFCVFFTGIAFLGPLVVWLIKKDEDEYVRQEALEALNFNLSVFIYGAVATVIALILTLILIGLALFLLIAIAGVVWFVFVIIGAMRANEGYGYRYPLTMRLIK